jgi:rRNA maturation endonuclease Nob1
MSSHPLSAKEILKDIRSGADDNELMEKYQLSAQSLQRVFDKLVTANVLKRVELENRDQPVERTTNRLWKCPACGEPQPREYEECPHCGVIARKFIKPQPSNLEEQPQQDERERKEKKIDGNGTKLPAFCHTCGQRLTAGAQFCASCGAPIQAIQLHCQPGRKQDPISADSKLVFFRRHLLVISGTILAIIIVGIVALGLKVASETKKNASLKAQKENFKYYDPMRNEIARDVKMIEMGLSFNDHREMTKSFIQRLGELQLGLKGKDPQLVSLLEEAATSLKDAQDAWEREIQCDTSARRHWCLKCSHADLYEQLRREANKKPNDYEFATLGVRIYDDWTKALETRQASWLNFKNTTDKALAVMTIK